MEAHSGIFIASPEYNASITPLLKNSLDWVSHIRDEGEAPLASLQDARLCAGLGLARRHGRPARASLPSAPSWSLAWAPWFCPTSLPFPRAHEAFDEHGHLKNKDARRASRPLIQKLARAAHVLHG